MPIPDFNHNNVLPPHLGNPTKIDEVSPYNVSSRELCEKLGTTAKRRTILKGFLSFRSILPKFGINFGFQWLDGSFLENIEISEERDPNDLDLVTFYCKDENVDIRGIIEHFPEFVDPELSKNRFLLDHYNVDLLGNPFNTVEYSRYWAQLFSHNRDGVWKGMIRVDINTPEHDEAALQYLNEFDDE